jgi:hypothetical protein
MKLLLNVTKPMFILLPTNLPRSAANVALRYNTQARSSWTSPLIREKFCEASKQASWEIVPRKKSSVVGLVALMLGPRQLQLQVEGDLAH